MAQDSILNIINNFVGDYNARETIGYVKVRTSFINTIIELRSLIVYINNTLMRYSVTHNNSVRLINLDHETGLANRGQKFSKKASLIEIEAANTCNEIDAGRIKATQPRKFEPQYKTLPDGKRWVQDMNLNTGEIFYYEHQKKSKTQTIQQPLGWTHEPVACPLIGKTTK